MAGRGGGDWTSSQTFLRRRKLCPQLWNLWILREKRTTATTDYELRRTAASAKPRNVAMEFASVAIKTAGARNERQPTASASEATVAGPPMLALLART